MLEEVRNHALFEIKINGLEKFSDNLNSSEFTESMACQYHGINLSFKTKSSQFIQSLKNLIPVEWLNIGLSENVIYLMAPEDFGYAQSIWSDELSQDCFSFENNTIAVQRDFAAKIYPDKVLLICEDKVGDGFYNFLRWYLSEKLMGMNKFVVHASCVLDKSNQAHLFLGHSGAGKTTITKLSEPRMVLGDDMNLVSLRDETLFVEAGAIGGQFNSMIGYDKLMPVKAVYWLKQSELNESVKLDHIQANQKLLASFANLHWPTLAQNKINQLMEFSLLATASVNFYELHFRNNESIWEYLDP